MDFFKIAPRLPRDLQTVYMGNNSVRYSEIIPPSDGICLHLGQNSTFNSTSKCHTTAQTTKWGWL